MLLRKEVLPALMQARELTPAELGRKVGRSPSAIWRLANGKVRRVKDLDALRLLVELDVRPSRLFVLPSHHQQLVSDTPSDGAGCDLPIDRPAPHDTPRDTPKESDL